MKKILVTCPPMVGILDSVRSDFTSRNAEVYAPPFSQFVPEEELIELVPQFDGWIIGDDPATRSVFESGTNGRLRAAVKWGVGVDNVDFAAANEFSLPITNTPQMFGPEVADLALGYILALARETFLIDRQIRAGFWPKPRGISTAGKHLGLVGFGDIGLNLGRRLKALDIKTTIYDPALQEGAFEDLGMVARWPCGLEECDFLVFTCNLNSSNHHMLNEENIRNLKQGVRIVNVARGPLIDESALINGLEQGLIHSAALDVFEVEPLPKASSLRDHERCILGSHNASNTAEAVMRATQKAIQLLFDFLEEA